MNIASTSGLMSFLQANGYIVMLLMMFIEGASVTYVAAFIASTGVFNIYIVLLISIVGFVAEDIALFFVGKHLGKKILKKYFYNKPVGKNLKRLASGINNHPGKTIAIVKLTPVIPIPGLIMIGASDIPVKKFISYSIIISTIYSVILGALGYYSGVALAMIAKDILNSDWMIAIAIILFIGVWYLTRFISRRVAEKA
jgi:membrane protein DedA with SNARE-associated domain